MWFFKILEFWNISAIFGPVAAIFRPFWGHLRGFQCWNQKVCLAKVVRSAILYPREPKFQFQSDPMTERGSKWPKSLKMAKNQQFRAFYAKKKSIFWLFYSQVERQMRVYLSVGHFWIRGGHFEFSRYQFEGFPVLKSKSLFFKSCP